MPEINITAVTIFIKEHLCSYHMLGTREVLRGTPESLRIAAAKVLTFLCMSSRRSKYNTESGNPTAPGSTCGPQSQLPPSLCEPCGHPAFLSSSPSSFTPPSPYFSFIHLPPLSHLHHMLSSHLLPLCVLLGADRGLPRSQLRCEVPELSNMGDRSSLASNGAGRNSKSPLCFTDLESCDP